MFYKLSEEDELRLVRDFTYRQPKEDQIPRFKEIREMAMVMARLLMEDCPRSRELSLALTNLESCVAHANMAIKRYERG